MNVRIAQVLVINRRMVSDRGLHRHDALNQVEVFNCSHVVVSVVARVFHEGTTVARW